ncbi:MAG TPA: type II CAAX endopeptidase family protein [Planctomycetota bacterium]|nr:type II CAAX endopeptidase family protein [Planctomycetota bacterium]
MLVYGIVWLVELVLGRSGNRVAFPILVLLYVIHAYSPLIAAVTIGWARGEREVRHPSQPCRTVVFFSLVAWLIAVVVNLAGVLSDIALMGARYESADASGVVRDTLRGMIRGPTLMAVVTFGEEWGWRAFLYERVRPFGFWRGSLLTGAVWGLWHAPGLLRLETPISSESMRPFIMLTAATILASPLFSLLYERSRSVVPCAVLHGTINSTAVLGGFAKAGSHDESILRSPGGLVVLVVCCAVVYMIWRRGQGMAKCRGGEGK